MGGNDVMDNTLYQSDDSDGLDANPWGAYLETDRGLDAAALAAAPLMGSQSGGARRNASAENVEANHTFYQSCLLYTSDAADE